MKQKIETIEEFNQLVGQNEKFLVFKHSLTCPVSQAAYDEFEGFMEAQPDVAAYYLYVQEARPLSNYIAEEYNIKHESPQALVFEGNTVSWNASHWKITKSSLKEGLSI
ncbi:bacillithiol system redox-active protein YtxJ [Bacillus sp. PS06]|uniref:bacillithiol system redox-active protein YtxJ n=1 Tax=Bacillus sp. PS06 TaxID=2764176 RepID=UPI001780B246|nr:bacillithiol system redox-active protein YtxJ [Bacillus sp. PS06]MBD8069001.1 bacillithiol system redox-active protein YtxJ [Bacillus sp. PS06]